MKERKKSTLLPGTAWTVSGFCLEEEQSDAERAIMRLLLTVCLYGCGHARGEKEDKSPFQHKRGSTSFLEEFPGKP